MYLGDIHAFHLPEDHLSWYLAVTQGLLVTVTLCFLHFPGLRGRQYTSTVQIVSLSGSVFSLG